MRNSLSKIILSLLVISLGLFTSCREQNTKDTNIEEDVEKAPPTTPSGNIDSKSPDTTTNDNSTSDSEVNPAHGEPGHRCDIPVGAPLDQATSQSRNTATSGQSPVRIKETSPDVNPPHGEPGHDCSVPVGAELNAG